MSKHSSDVHFLLCTRPKSSYGKNLSRSRWITFRIFWWTSSKLLEKQTKSSSDCNRDCDLPDDQSVALTIYLEWWLASFSLQLSFEIYLKLVNTADSLEMEGFFYLPPRTSVYLMKRKKHGHMQYLNKWWIFLLFPLNTLTLKNSSRLKNMISINTSKSTKTTL